MTHHPDCACSEEHCSSVGGYSPRHDSAIGNCRCGQPCTCERLIRAEQRGRESGRRTVFEVEAPHNWMDAKHVLVCAECYALRHLHDSALHEGQRKAIQHLRKWDSLQPRPEQDYNDLLWNEMFRAYDIGVEHGTAASISTDTSVSGCMHLAELYVGESATRGSIIECLHCGLLRTDDSQVPPARSYKQGQRDTIVAAMKITQRELDDPQVTHWPVETTLERVRDEIEMLGDAP
jgi:hypothetical protein